MTFRSFVFATVFAAGVGGVALWLGRGRFEPDRRIVSIAVHASGRWIAAATRAGSITVLDRDSPHRLVRLETSTGEINDLQFNPEGVSLAIASRNLITYAVKDLTLLRTLRSDGRNYGTARFSSDGRRLLTITGAGTIEVLDAISGETLVNACCSTIYGETAFDPDGKMMITAGHWPAFWDVRTGKLIRRLTGDREFLTFSPITFDSRRSWILMGSQDGRVYGWDSRTGKRTATSPGHAGYVDSIAALRDSPWISYATFGGSIRLWNPDSGEERLLAVTAPSSNLVAGTDPKSVFYGTAAGFIELWDIAGERRLQRFDLR